MAKTTKTLVGKTVTIPAGTKVTTRGVTAKRATPSTVTVRAIETTRSGKTVAIWKSNGYKASAVLSD
jgi:hypothetical protein